MTNKGKPEITKPRTKETINHREEVNNQTLPTMQGKIDQPKILNNKMRLDATLHCAQTSHASCVRSIGTIRMNSTSWFVPSKPFTMRFNMLPLWQPKLNPTWHHQGPHPWSSKTLF